MQLSKLLLPFLVACTASDGLSTGSIERSVEEDPCTAKEPWFANYDELKQCEKSNPEVFLTSINALVESGGTCKVADEKTGTCLSIEPIEDKETLERRLHPFRCIDTYCRFTPDGAWKCDPVRSCCVYVDDGTQEEYCIPYVPICFP